MRKSDSSAPGGPTVSVGDPRRWISLRTLIVAVGIVLMTAVIIASLQHLTKHIAYTDLLAAIHATPSVAILLAVLATAASFLALSGYDFSALSYVGAQVPRRVVLLTSFIAYALGNTVGLGVLTGGAVRLRMYSAAGVEAAQLARAIAFNALAFGVGITTLAALGLLWGAHQAASFTGISPRLLQSLAAALLMAVTAFITLCAARREIVVWRFTLVLPTATLALRQLLISVVELTLSAAALWALLPHGEFGFAGFCVIYVVAIAVGMISHVPGGLGVFEAVMLLGLSSHLPADGLAGALVLYRGIYYLLPMLVAVILLAGLELRKSAAVPAFRAAARLLPWFLSGWAWAVGIMLLISGATPATDEASELLSLHVPLPLVEASHLIGSVAGIGFLFVARGLLHRIDAAWWAALGLTLLSFWLALPKGLAVGEMTILGLLGAALLASRKEFHRRASLLTVSFSASWLVAVGGVVAVMVWVLLFAYRDVDYANQLWWQFTFDGHAPRSLRAAMAVAVTVLCISLWQLLRPASARPKLPDAEALQRALAIVRTQPRAEAQMVMTGDKSLLFSASGKAFLMYGKRGRSWVAFGDPVGPPREWPELVWQFIETATAHGDRAVFYQVRPQSLPMYLDAGLRMLKLGEHACVNLTDFSLKGSARANLRHGASRGEREGLQFEWAQGEQIEAWLGDLRQVSDAWLAAHKAREKGFSLGRFDADYLRSGAVAVARDAQGRIVAFLSILLAAANSDCAVDLMRHREDAPRGTMDFLFARTLEHLRDSGYQSFGLGVAPLSGMVEHPLASRWQRFARTLFAYGEPLYHFQGLRAFKEKFAPDWEPRYLVAPGGIAPLWALADIATLISGGIKGVVTK